MTARTKFTQVSLFSVLLSGRYDGVITLAELKKMGGMSIATMDRLDGEIQMIDGVVYQAIYDGSVVTPPDSETVPFSNVTFFDPDLHVQLTDVPDMASLQEQLNQVVRENGANLFYMVKIPGEFSTIKVRSEYKQEKPYRELDVALAEDQVECDYENIRGTMVGLYCPSFMSGLNSVGWHFHFISEDLTRGGHVLQVSVGSADAALDSTPGFTLGLPEEDGDFQSMDLGRNMDEAIHRAETATTSDSGAEDAAEGAE